MCLKVELPLPVDRELRAAIKGAYELAIQEVDEHDFSYVLRKTPRVVTRLKSQGNWLVKLAQTAFTFHLYLNEKQTTLRGKQAVAVRQITAALFYLCDPFDIIPDATPSTGYLDDALVINQCLSKLRARSPDIYQYLREISTAASTTQLFADLTR